MGDENPILTLRDYSKPRHEGYMNTIELLIGNNVTDEELTKKELKQVEADDQASQTILLGLPEEIYYKEVTTTQVEVTTTQVEVSATQELQENILSVVQAMMSPGGSIVASLKNVNSFLVVNTPPDDLIRTDFQQEGVVPKVMLHILEEFVLFWDDIPLTTKFPAWRRTQRSNLGLESCLLQRYFNAEWSVYTMLLDKTRYGRNFSKAYTTATNLDEIDEFNANCILMANLQQASTSSTQTDNAPVNDLDGSAEVHHYENCYNNDIFNMFTQEEQYIELLKPISEPHQVQHNDNNVIHAVSSVEQDGGIVEQHLGTIEETRAYIESLYNNLAI
nr:hypothetical protein [Tanacetum cinerariifolium]